MLPPPDATLLTAYNNLIDEIEHRIQDLTRQRSPALLHCHPGCSDCCIEFAVLPLEAALLQDALLHIKRSAIVQENHCVFLLENCHCSVYDRRPILCRTQGLALAYIDHESGTIEVSACPINFQEEFCFEQDDLFFMDDFNGRLAVLNLQYCRQAGLQPDCRIALSDIAGSLR
jgi:Fe-S-cluster containining protein